MGDPGLPIMVGLLAVPVGVLLLVLLLTLMGGRWARSVPVTESVDDAETGYDEATGAYADPSAWSPAPPARSGYGSRGRHEHADRDDPAGHGPDVQRYSHGPYEAR